MVGFRALLLVGLGGFVGSIGRYVLSGWVHRLMPYAAFPWGTLAVNVSGCFLIGLFSGLADSRQLWGPELRLFVMLGVLGGFTTFSSFAYETAALARDADLLRALANVALQVVIGLAAAWLAYAIAR
jgi:CrcB protein